MSLLLLIGASALAVDISALWLDRSTDQKITDSAAAAGILEAVSTSPQAGCEAALAYVAVNSDEIGTLSDAGCAPNFPTSCNPVVTRSHTVSSGRHNITVTHPVSDADPLMTSGLVGATSQPATIADGFPCDRLAVQISATRDSVFAQLLGFDQGTTTVHTVAKATDEEGNPPINLLVLDRHGCEALKVEGQARVIADARIQIDDVGNPIGLLPGIAAADSDAGSGCTTGVIRMQGTTSLLRADGPECPTQTGTHAVGPFTAGEGCGLIQTVAPGPPGCNLPSCVPGGGSNPPQPTPTRISKPYTREKVDHRYNCSTDYTTLPAASPPLSWATEPLTVANEQDIKPCTNGDPDHIYDLIDFVKPTGTPPGWTTWNAECIMASSGPAIIFPAGQNVVINCPLFEIKRHVQINGNVIFNGAVFVTSGSGHLEVNNSLASPGWAFFRGGGVCSVGTTTGNLCKAGNANLTFNYTMVYMTKLTNLAFEGGSGSLTWIAPDSGPFDDLALWSDSPLDQHWAGQASLDMEGLFFMPWAKANYRGNGGISQTNAQWIADKLWASGNGTLIVRPSPGRGVSLEGVVTTLIR